MSEAINCNCGGKPLVYSHTSGFNWNKSKGWVVQCTNCKIKTTASKTKDEAIRVWNMAMGILNRQMDKEFATIEGDGDLHYCGYCKADLSNAWIEHYDYCPECKKAFSNSLI